MALVQYRMQAKDVNITKRMGAPKKMTMDAWFKQCRKVIPEIPNVKDTDWIIKHEHADFRWIKYELVNSIGEKCEVVVDRTQPFIGAK